MRRIKGTLALLAAVCLLVCTSCGRDGEDTSGWSEEYRRGYEDGYEEGYLAALSEYGLE